MKNTFSLLAVLLITGFAALPGIAQEQSSAGTRLTERIYQNQYGPFLEAESTFSNSVKESTGLASAPAVITAPSSASTSWKTLPFQDNASIALRPATGVPTPQTHNLPSLWGSVQPKTQGADSPWADVR